MKLAEVQEAMRLVKEREALKAETARMSKQLTLVQSENSIAEKIILFGPGPNGTPLSVPIDREMLLSIVAAHVNRTESRLRELGVEIDAPAEVVG